VARTRYHGQQRSEQRTIGPGRLQGAVLRRSRSAIWWRSSKISASFHAEDRRESLNQEGTRTTSRNTNRRHMTDDHRRAVAKIATRSLR
jgi:hypothetical protein